MNVDKYICRYLDRLHQEQVGPRPCQWQYDETAVTYRCGHGFEVPGQEVTDAYWHQMRPGVAR
jgi:hypothetical protein